MVVSQNEIQQYLDDYHKGKISEGLGIGCELDVFLRFKQGTLNMILGHDNTGKTYWRCWYYLCLSVKHNLKWCIWTGENKAGQIVRNLIQCYTGRRLRELSQAELYRYQQEIAQWFTFVDNNKFHKFTDLLEIFDDGDYNGCLIDPYTGLDRKYDHASNYDFLNAARQWVIKTGKTLDVCSHPISESGRSKAVYPPKHEWAGHIRNPFKAEIEGGKPFANRCDDFMVLHRLTAHPLMKSTTLLYIEKIKDDETGGQVTMFDVPLMFDFNRGLGFKINGINPITDKWVKPEADAIKPNENFDATDTDFTNEFQGIPF